MDDHMMPTWLGPRFIFYEGRERVPHRERQLSGILSLCEYIDEKCMEDTSSFVYVRRENLRRLVIDFPMGKVMRNGLLPITLKNFTIDFDLEAFVPGYPRSEDERTRIVVCLPRSIVDITCTYKEPVYKASLWKFIALMKIFINGEYAYR